jgi:hypothetical protein
MILDARQVLARRGIKAWQNFKCHVAASGVTHVDQWPAMIDWLLDQHARFRRAIQAIGGLGSLA